MSQIDPYSILEIKKDASQDEIKNAYRNSAKKYHPDLNPGNKAYEAKFKEINEAYNRISTPELRAKYDQGGFRQDFENPFTGAPGGRESYSYGDSRRGPFYSETQEGEGGRYSFSFEEGASDSLFESLFEGLREKGGKGSARRAASGSDLSLTLQIDLKDTLTGTKKEVVLPTGNKISVNIPKGITSGNRLRLAGLGEPGVQGGRPGDVYIEIQVRPLNGFRQEGDNLMIELPISIPEALFGGEVQVPTVDGDVKLVIPPRVNTDKKLRIQDHGVFNRKTKRRGDQIVILRVMLPSVADSDLERAIRKWSENHSYNPRLKNRDAA